MIVHSNSLLPRNQVTGYGLELSEKTEIKPALMLKIPDKVTAPILVKILFQVHEYKGLKPPREFRTYLREAKKLLDEIGAEKSIELIKVAGAYSRNPFGFQLVRRLNDIHKNS